MCTSIDRHPGKFEGESCITSYAYHWSLEGDGDTNSAEDGTSETLILGPFDMASIYDYQTTWHTHVCRDCYNEILLAENILLNEGSTGFVTSDLNVNVVKWWAAWERYAQATEDELVDYLVSI